MTQNDFHVRNGIIVDTGNQVSIGNSTVNTVINATSVIVSNGSTTSVINITGFNNTANNSTYLNGNAASNFALISGLSANVSTLTANNSTYLNGNAASNFALISGLASNVSTLTANNSTNLGGTLASSYLAGTSNTTTDLQLHSLGIGTAASGTAGEIRATNDVTAYYSDVRLKMDFAPIDNPLEKIQQLAGLYYTQNELAEKYGYHDYRRQVGLLAQDVEKVLPEAVRPAPFDCDQFDHSITGKNYLTVKYERIIPLLIEGIKQLASQVDELKKR